MAWVAVCRLGELAPDCARKLEGPDGEPVLIVRAGEDVFAVSGLCTHRRLPLEGGRVVGQEIVCPWHQGRFCLRTGAVRSLPATGRLRTYDVKLEADQVLINLEDDE